MLNYRSQILDWKNEHLFKATMLHTLIQKLEFWREYNAIYLTIIPRARMASESIAHEAEGPMGY